jgi:hypothetical protein
MVRMEQKTGDYCFVACVASALLDEGNEKLLEDIGYKREEHDENYNRLQDLIVSKFPQELQRDGSNPGIPKKHDDVKKVLVGLKLATSVEWKQISANEAKKYLLNNKHKTKSIFIAPNPTHCVRLSEISDDGVTIMDPTEKDFKKKSWNDFEMEFYALTVF